METGKVTLSFTEANYRQAMTVLIAAKIPFSGTVDVQQLKAEIAAKCNHALNPSYVFSKEQLLNMFRELRQLSAV